MQLINDDSKVCREISETGVCELVGRHGWSLIDKVVLEAGASARDPGSTACCFWNLNRAEAKRSEAKRRGERERRERREIGTVVAPPSGGGGSAAADDNLMTVVNCKGLEHRYI